MSVRPMPTPDVLMENLAFVQKQMEDTAVNKHATPHERTIACALEVTIANLLEIFKQASMSWPAQREPLAALWHEVHDVPDSNVLQSHSALSLLEHLRSIA